LLIAQVSSGQSADEIIEKNFNAVGMDKIAKINSVVTVSEMTQMGMKFNVTEMKKRPGFHKSVAEVNGMKIVSIFNGKEAWMLNPMMGSTDPIPVTGDELVRLKYQSQIEGMLYTCSKDKDVKIEYKGTSTSGDKTYEQFAITLPNSDLIIVSLDNKTYYVEKLKIEQQSEAGNVSSEIVLGDHKKVDGMVFPHSAAVSVNGQPMFTSVIKSIKLNEDIPDSEFAK